MRHPIPLILTILALLCGPFAAALNAGESTPRVVVEIERNRIYEGESVLYRVTVENLENPREPTLEGFDDIEIVTLGQQSLDQQTTIIINGRRTENIRRGRQFNYKLTPKKAGKILLPAPTVEVDGQSIRGQEASLLVIAPQDQDIVRMDIAAEPAAVYPLQPFKITLTISVKAMPDSLGERNPISVQPNPPALEIPWVEDARLPDGLVPQTDLAHWLGPLENGRGWGFAVNNIGSNSVLAIFQERKMAFMPEPEKVHLSDKSGKDAVYWQFKFSRTFIPKRIGDYSFGPVTLKGEFAATIDPDRGILGKNVFVVAKPITVRVKDVPRDGRPDSYIGAVGQFRLSAELTPQKVKTGDPMTLVLSLDGEGTLDTAKAPNLSKNPTIVKNFKIYEATEQSKDRKRRFTYGLRPLTTDLKEFPPIEVAYFNVQTEQYDTLRTESIPIEISAAEKLAGRDVVAASNGNSPGKNGIETRREGIYANFSDGSRLSNQSIEPVVWATTWATMLGGYGFLVLLVSRVRRRNGDTARLRRNSAAKNARHALKKGLQELAAGRDRAGAEAIEDAMLNFLADWTNLPAAGMTSADAHRLLESMGVPTEIIAATSSCLEQSGAVRFGGTLHAVETLRKEAQPVLEQLIKSLQKTKRGAK